MPPYADVCLPVPTCPVVSEFCQLHVAATCVLFLAVRTQVLYRHPRVGQAAVVGIPHASGAGDQIVAWVSTKQDGDAARLTIADVYQHCRAEQLPGWQMPDSIELSEIPLPTNGGKIAKKLLRAPSYVRQKLAMGLLHSLEQTTSSWQDQANVLFDRIDADSSGFLDEGELKAAAGEQATSLVSAIDSDRDGIISRVEWLLALSNLPDHEREQTISTIGSLLASYERASL